MNILSNLDYSPASIITDNKVRETTKSGRRIQNEKQQQQQRKQTRIEKQEDGEGWERKEARKLERRMKGN
ncbi:hypothetical protein FH972_014090 [Carpinus fangiana]|uniref:Uncharacterized protein n=1 Tax=Carpinus fangiana TaxID=176857 RepID=A0A5N6R8N7_9ROSI|nr:hypothetical protein FH972_014090 [Carpinus fangiana]